MPSSKAREGRSRKVLWNALFSSSRSSLDIAVACRRLKPLGQGTAGLDHGFGTEYN